MSNHDANARLEMLRQTIDRNRDKVSDQHEFVEREIKKEEKASCSPQEVNSAK